MKFILLYKGPATSPEASHTDWPEWFQKIGPALVDRGSPMMNGLTVQADSSRPVPGDQLNGFSIIQADSVEAARLLIADHPYLMLGADYSIEMYEIK